MTTRRADLPTVDLLYAEASGQQLTPEQTERVQRCTAQDFDALDALLDVQRSLLDVEREELADRLRAHGLHDLARQLPELKAPRP